MFNIKIRIFTIVMLSLFLSSAFLVGIGATPTNLTVRGDEGLTSLADDVYGQSRMKDPVSILVYTQFADLSSGGEYQHTMSAIDAEYGTSYQYANLTDYHGFTSVINEYDILLIPEQENAYVANMTVVGSAWASTLNGFIANGGIVIVMDYWGPLNTASERLGITSRILNVSGLLTITDMYDQAYSSMVLHDDDDALALGVASSFSAPDGAMTYVTTDGVDVAGDASGALAIHKIIGKGHLVLLGFDLYSTEANCVKMLGNSIRLHHHVLVDASHGQTYHVPVELSILATLLAAQGFAVSTMSTFDPAVLAACDVLVITYSSIIYNTTEVNQIENFVTNGGGLYIAQEWASNGNEMDPVTERFGYVRNKTTYLTDTDDYTVNQYWIVLNAENAHNHSATLLSTQLEIYAATAFIQVPTTAFSLFTTDIDNTTRFAAIPANGAVFAAASTHQEGRVIVVGDGNFLSGTSDTDGDATLNINERNNANFAVNSIRWLLASGIEEKTVLFDESHNPTYHLLSSYIDFAYFLTLNGYTLHWMTTFYETMISATDILVIVDGSIDYTTPQIGSIVSYVNNGGSLYLLGDWSVYGQQVDNIGAEFGLVLNGTGYIEDSDDYNTYSSVIAYNTSNFATHPIMQGVNHIELDRSCGFSSIGAGVALVTTDNDGTSTWSGGSPANNVPVIAATTYNKGRVIFVPDMEIFSTDDPDGDGVVDIYESDNDIFSVNVFAWLVANRAPTVHLTFPNGGELLNGTQVITWTAVDFDSDTLTYEVFYSDNNGSDWTSLVTSISSLSYEWNTTLFDDGNAYLIRVVAFDGQATGQDQSDGAFELDNFIGGSGLPLDPMLLLLIGAGVIIVVIVIVIVMKKGGGGKK